VIGEQFVEAWLQVPKQLNGEPVDSEVLRDPEKLRENSVFFRFFCCYLAFNHLYSNYYRKWRNAVPDWKKGVDYFLKSTREREGGRQAYRYVEREALMRFVDRALKVLAEEGHRFSLPEADNAMHHEVWNTEKDVEDECVADITKEIERVKDDGEKIRLQIIRCFLRIYQVRCNLFHGGKSVASEGDRRKVVDAASYLERFMWSCLKDSRGRVFS